MPEACNETACCSGGSDIGGIVIDDCGSAMCSISGAPVHYHSPFVLPACRFPRIVYTAIRTKVDYVLFGPLGEPGDNCYIKDGGSIRWGYEENTWTDDTYCQPMKTVRTLDGTDNGCSDMEWNQALTVLREFIEPTEIFRTGFYSNGVTTFTYEFVITLSGAIDLDALPANCTLENGFDSRFKIGCGGVAELVSKAPIEFINLIGRVAWYGSSISGFAMRPYKIIETTTIKGCPDIVSTTCQSFPKSDVTTADQVDCITLTPAKDTALTVESGAC